MNKDGQMRELLDGEQPFPGEIEVPGDEAKKLAACSTKACKAYYRAIKQGLTPAGALSCALAEERRIRAK